MSEEAKPLFEEYTETLSSGKGGNVKAIYREVLEQFSASKMEQIRLNAEMFGYPDITLQSIAHGIRGKLEVEGKPSFKGKIRVALRDSETLKGVFLQKVKA